MRLVSDMPNLTDIIMNKSVATQFQPIISVNNMNIAGVEALSRGIMPDNTKISPAYLFNRAFEQGLVLELDRLCREKAIEKFSALEGVDRGLSLFLNIDTAIVDMGVVGSGHIMQVVNQCGLQPGNVVIEIVESKVRDIAALKRFVQIHKNYGFLIALDDLGQGWSNLDRILQVKPDIIKIDRNIIKGIDGDYYKQEMFKALSMMAKKFGALVVAEGIETKEEAVYSIGLGADMLQGYYFSRPQDSFQNQNDVMGAKFDCVLSKYKSLRYHGISNKSSEQQLFQKTISNIIADLTGTEAASLAEKIEQLADEYSVVEYLYLLDMSGKQITSTISSTKKTNARKNRMFQPAQVGTDQSMKDYFLYVQAGEPIYTTQPYMSLATGSLCVTTAASFYDKNNTQYILCVDFGPNHLASHNIFSGQ